MAEKFVLYKLLKFGNGHVTPPGIVDGGSIWSKGEKIDDTIFIGKINCDENTKTLPEGVIETVEQDKIDEMTKSRDATALSNYKKKMYSKHTDPMFIEAMRDKLTGDETKWKKYLEIITKIKKLKTIPTHENFL